jgi:hypothetical protein
MIAQAAPQEDEESKCMWLSFSSFFLRVLRVTSSCSWCNAFFSWAAPEVAPAIPAFRHPRRLKKPATSERTRRRKAASRTALPPGRRGEEKGNYMS